MLGEFGTLLNDPQDTVWLNSLVTYLGRNTGANGMSWTFWSWNPNSGDTGGILNDDWTTVNQTKHNLLVPMLFPLDGGGTPTNTPLGPTFTPTRTNTPTGPTFTPTRTPTSTNTPTGPTLTPTRTPTQGPGACSPVTATITAPFTRDGVGTFCWQTSNLGSFINSWNLASLKINGIDFTNKWAASSSYPAKINGFWYISYTGNFPWSHFEAK
jgi:hypothetical protein